MIASIRRSHVRLWRTPLLLATAAMLLLAACDSDEADSEDDMEVASPTATTAVEASPAPTEAPATTETPAATDTPAEPMDGTTVALATEGDLAPYLVDAEGMTLYLFTNDEAGMSSCTGDCLVNWPPLLVEDGEEPTAGEGVTGELGTIEREDGGGTQVTYDGMPLYYWQGDAAPGDTTGHEVGDVWFVVPPTAE